MIRSILSAILVAVATWQVSTPQLPAANPRPNILFLFTDDQPQNCLGIMGNDHIKTPHLDALARRGTLFNNAFVTTAICCSSRASILNGQRLYRHGIDDFKKPLSAAAFATMYPALLRQSGYRTGYLGKYAIGNPACAERELSLPAGQFDDWLSGNSVVIFSSDHGSLPGDHGLTGKWLMCENSVRIPLISGNRRMLKVVGDSHILTRIFNADRHGSDVEILEATQAEHEAIVAAISPRDPDAARDAMRRLIRNSLDLTLREPEGEGIDRWWSR